MKKNITKSDGKKALNSALLLILVLLIVAVSGCIANFPFAQQAGILNPTVVSETPDISVKAEAVPLEVRSGKNLALFFEVDALKDLKDVSLNVTDMCLFSGDLKGLEIPDMKEGRGRSFKETLTAGSVDFDTGCQIRFKANYSASLMATQDIIVLDDAEFLGEQNSGKIGERIPQFVSTSNPLRVSFSFSDPQPFQNGTDEFMYISFSANAGLQKLDKGSVQLTMPNNANITCDDYTADGGKLVLNRGLVFTNGDAKKSTCKISAQARQSVDSKTIQLTANYLYAIDNSINVKIMRK